MHLILWTQIRQLFDSDERGASLVEYALLVGLIAVVCVSGITAFGGGVGGSMSHSASSIISVNG